MLTHEENEFMCRVGPGTPMGAALRRYWLPACGMEDLPEADGDPIRVRIVGEDFVAFRDSDGRVGVLDESCCHRGASLVLGRVEDGGIRCLYHGWKYAVDGTILETPNMPDARFRRKVKAPAYPVREAGGLVWVYLGPPDKEPAFPHYEWFDLPSNHRLVVPALIKANFVQVLEGGTDSTHVGVLHQDALPRVPQDGLVNEADVKRAVRQPEARIDAKRTTFGMYCAVSRDDPENESLQHVRVTTFVCPNLFYIPGTAAIMAQPLDDERTIFYQVFYDAVRPLAEEPHRSETLEFFGCTDALLAGWYREASRENNFFQDRGAMRRGESFTGLPTFLPEDAAMMGSMGGIYDRSKEHLVPADLGVIRMRRILIDSARRVQRGENPIGHDVDYTRVRAAAETLARTAGWETLVEQDLLLSERERRTVEL